MKAGDITIDLTLDDRNFSVSVKNAGALLSQLQGELKRTVTATERIDRRMGSLSTSFRHFVMSAAAVRYALMDINDVFLSLPKAILKTTGEFERTLQLMKGLSTAADEAGRIKEAGEAFKYVLNLSKNAPFEIGALTDTFVKLKTGGLDPLDGSLQALVDGTAKFGGNSDVLKRAAIAMQQMGGKGVISMEELRQQLGEAVPTAMASMARGMGLSMAQLAKAIETGTVQSGDALKRMLTVMTLENAGAAQAMMTTWTGMTSRLKTEWAVLLNDAGQSGFADAVKKQVGDITTLLSTSAGKRFAMDVGNSLAEVVTALRAFADLIRENWELVKTLGTIMTTVFTVKMFVGAIAGITSLGRSFQQFYQANVVQGAQAIQMERQIAAAKIVAERDALNAKKAAIAEELAANRAKYAAARAQHAKYLRDIRALDAANYKLLNGPMTPNAADTYSRNRADMNRAAFFSKETEVIVAAGKKERESLLQTQRELETTTAKTDMLARKKTELAGKVGLATRALSAGQWVLGAMGGWIGLVTTALIAGVSAWIAYGKDGSEAINKLREAVNRGFADKSTVSGLEEYYGETLPGQIKALDKQIADAEPFEKFVIPGLTNSNADELKELRDRRTAMQAELAKGAEVLAKARENALANTGNDAAARLERELGDQLSKSGNAFVRASIANNEAREKALSGLKEGSAEYLKVQGDFVKKDRAIMMEQAQNHLQIAQDARARLLKEQEGATDEYARAGIEGSIAAADRQILAAQQTIQSVKDMENALKMGSKKDKPPKVDPVQRMLERSKASLNEAMIRLDDLEDGVVTYERLYDSILAKLRGDRAAGSLKATDAQLAQIATNKAQEQSIERLAAATLKLNKIDAEISASQASRAAALNDADYYERQSTGVADLDAQLRKLINSVPEGTEGLDAFKERAKGLVSRQAVLDLADFTRELKETTRELQIANIENPNERFAAELARDFEEMDRMFRVRIENIEREAQSTADAAREKQRAEEAYFKWREARYQEHLINTRTPLQQLSMDWQNSQQQINEVVVDWSTKSMDAIVKMASTGKFEMRELVTSILGDVARISFQKSFGNALTGLMGSLGNGLQTALSMPGAQPGGLPATAGWAMPAAPGAGGDAAGIAADSLGALTKNTEKLGTAAEGGTQGLLDMAKATAGNIVQTLASSAAKLFGIGVETAAATTTAGQMQLMSFAMGNATGDLLAFSASLKAAQVAGAIPFANGGIMTGKGSMPLKAYAKGGIANSPQLALFGEGSMAEAFVPLPDGRSIPVTMRGDLSGAGGGGAPIVNINISVVEGDEQTASSGDTGAWSQLATQVKSMVLETMVKEKRPGGLLTR